MSVQLNELELIFREVLENEDISINPQTVAADIVEWDSINHIYLIVAIEKQYKIKFTTYEIQSWTNVGDMLNNINKLKNK
jgi:acyl carrier protein